MQLYSISKYKILPPGKVILKEEQFERDIVVIINGQGALVAKDNEHNILYTVNMLFPGESIGDVHLTN